MQALDQVQRLRQGDIMLHPLHQFTHLCYRAAHNFVRNFGFEMAGYLTFLSLLSLFPYLLVLISAVGLIGQGEAGREYIELALAHLPPEAVKTIHPRIAEILSGPPQGLLTFAVLGAIWTSSSGIEAIRGILNRAYHVGAPPAYLRRRLLSILQVVLFTLGIVCIVAVLVITPIAVNNFTDFTGIEIPLKLKTFIDHYFLLLAGLALFFIVASLYYVLPNLKQSRASVMPGAVLVIALWLAGAQLVSFYLTKVSQLTVVYGSLSGFIGTLIFFYVMLVIFIYGAEFNHELILARGKRIIEQEKSPKPAPAPPPH
jgi:membrane protein